MSAMIVEQLGLAITPLCWAAASGFTSGTTNGTRSSKRQALVLSMTVAPLATQRQACSRDNEPPADEKTTSERRLPSAGSSSMVTEEPRNASWRPADRFEA